MATPRIRETAIGSTVSFVGGGSVMVKTGSGRVSGMFCSTASDTPTMALYDSSATGTTTGNIIQEFTPVSATMYNFGIDVIYSKGLQALAGGTVKATFFISY